MFTPVGSSSVLNSFYEQHLACFLCHFLTLFINQKWEGSLDVISLFFYFTVHIVEKKQLSRWRVKVSLFSSSAGSRCSTLQFVSETRWSDVALVSLNIRFLVIPCIFMICLSLLINSIYVGGLFKSDFLLDMVQWGHVLAPTRRSTLHTICLSHYKTQKPL